MTALTMEEIQNKFQSYLEWLGLQIVMEKIEMRHDPDEARFCESRLRVLKQQVDFAAKVLKVKREEFAAFIEKIKNDKRWVTACCLDEEHGIYLLLQESKIEKKHLQLIAGGKRKEVANGE